MQDRIELTDAQKKAQRSRSVALALALGGLVILFYVVTVAKMGAAIFDRTL